MLKLSRNFKGEGVILDRGMWSGNPTLFIYVTQLKATAHKQTTFMIMKATCPQQPILSAFHLQGPKSNIYIYIYWLPLSSKQLIGIQFPKWSRQ